MRHFAIMMLLLAGLFTACSNEEDNPNEPGNPTNPTNPGSLTKTFRLVVSGTPAGGGTQPFTVNYKPTNSTGVWEWTENVTTGTFERNVQAQKDSTLFVFVHGDFATLFLFDVKLYEGTKLVKSFTKACEYSGITYTVQ